MANFGQAALTFRYERLEPRTRQAADLLTVFTIYEVLRHSENGVESTGRSATRASFFRCHCPASMGLHEPFVPLPSTPSLAVRNRLFSCFSPLSARRRRIRNTPHTPLSSPLSLPHPRLHGFAFHAESDVADQ